MQTVHKTLMTQIFSAAYIQYSKYIILVVVSVLLVAFIKYAFQHITRIVQFLKKLQVLLQTADNDTHLSEYELNLEPSENNNVFSLFLKCKK